MFSILLTYSLLLLLVFLFQRKMIYFPDTYSIEDQQQRADQANLKLWPSTDDYRGLIAKTSTTTYKGTVIVFHGNAGSATDRTYYLDALEKLGYRVILAEYPGYAARKDSPSEQALIADGIQTAKQALNDFGGPVFLWGESSAEGWPAALCRAGRFRLKVSFWSRRLPAWPMLPNTITGSSWPNGSSKTNSTTLNICKITRGVRQFCWPNKMKSSLINSA